MRRRRFLKTGGLAELLAAMPRAFARAVGYPRALQGPMAGAPGPNHFTIWTRASGLFDVTLEYSTDRDFATVIEGPTATATAIDEGCVVLRAENLQPDTDYWYRLRYAGEHDRYQPLPYRTRTAPAGPAKFRVAFGSCCRIQFDQEQRIWNAVRALEPDMFLWLGDNIYAASDQPDALVDLYARGRTLARPKPLLPSVPQHARCRAAPCRTPTAPWGPGKVRVPFGCCCRVRFEQEQPRWKAVRALEPDMWLWRGDNICADSDQPGALVDLYAGGRTVERLEPLLRSLPQRAPWDDRDF